MFDTLSREIERAGGLSGRQAMLGVNRRVLMGTIYDVLPFEFHEERSGSGEYVPLRQRRPNVRYNLCRLVVSDSVTFLFGEGRWPAIECADRPTQQALADVLEESRFAAVMADAAFQGSVGSVAVLMQVLKGRVFWRVMQTDCLTPAWDPEAPDTLATVTERYLVTGRDLRERGYRVRDIDLDARFWWQRLWGTDAETWFVPQTVEDANNGKPAVEDSSRSVRHGLGFVPLAWVCNLPGGIAPDGACTFRPAVETSIEIDYQLSQAGRGLKYSSDPTLLIKEPAATDGEMVRGAANALVVSEKGDAKLLEIGGTASAAVIEYVRALREMALESVRGNRSHADRVTAAQSGRAMELLHQALINLADDLRTSYGQALLQLARMVVRARQRYPLQAFGAEVAEMSLRDRLVLRWPPYFTPTHQDQQIEANTLGALRRDGMISQETSVARTGATWDFVAQDELPRIKADEVAADARAKAQAAQIQDKQALPA